MPVPSRIWTVIYCSWSWFLFPDMPVPDPLADQVFNYPIAEEKGEDAGKEKEPPENCLWHFVCQQCWRNAARALGQCRRIDGVTRKRRRTM